MIEFSREFKPLLIYDTHKSFTSDENNYSVHGFWEREGKLDFY